MTYYAKLPGEPSPKVIGLVGFDGVAALDLTGPLEALARARRVGETAEPLPCYKPILLGLTNKSVTAESGLLFRADTTLATAGPLDTIIVPGGEGLRRPETIRPLADWLKERAGSTRRIAAVSTGAYALAQSGLLDGRHATTHWRFARDLARRFPKLRVNFGAAFLKDGNFYTSGGGTAGVEMTLALIEEDCGSQLARAVARELVMRLRPPGEAEEQFQLADYESDPAERIADLPAWIVGHLQENLTVEALAARACLCPRHFSRLFKKVFNCTPADFVEELRLSEARRRLLGLRATVESIAESVGFHSSDSFRRAFERRTGTTPTLFRRRATTEVRLAKQAPITRASSPLSRRLAA
jgi:transcriptional regulator GlxA family with amidase domain